MKTVGEVFDLFKHELQSQYEANELNAVTLWTLNEVTGKSNAQLKAFHEATLSAEDINRVQSILKQLRSGTPLQYAIGHTEFYGLDFKVTPAVLIPRPETEELVDWVLHEVKNEHNPQHILDIGTGSGCIAIALKKHLSDAVVAALDISAEALNIAESNALLNDVQISLIQANILDTHIINQSFSVIVSNPPYVTQTDKRQMHDRVNNHEPHLALFVPEEDPLLFYKAIADFALLHLIPGGKLFVEINETFGLQTMNMLSRKGFTNLELRADMYGRDRMIKAIKLN